MIFPKRFSSSKRSVFSVCMFPITLCLFILLSFSSLSAQNIIDLEEMKQDFVLETKRINVPGYPHAFNPSIVRWNGSLLLLFRNIPNPKFSFCSYLGVVYLDEDFNPISTPQILETQSPQLVIPSRADDGRLLVVNDRLWLVFSDNKDTIISKGGFRVYLSELVETDGHFDVNGVECLRRYEGESVFIREKNWTPFNFQGKMHLIYSLTPHLIFEPLHGTESCLTAARSASDVQWDYGVLRGGTTALPVDNEYLTFFHSQLDMETVHSDGKSVAHYFMGAYTFSLDPPFEITKFSPEPIIGKDFYHGEIYKPYWKAVRVVFPGGFVYDDHYFWITYGRQDHECWVVKLDRPGLMNSLTSVNKIIYE